MKFTSLRDGGIVVTTMLMASTGVSSAGLDCTKVSAGGQTFNLWSLRGPHSVSTWRENPPKIVNTTYTVDICRGLKMKGDVSKERQCAQGTRVCALQHLWDPKDEDKEELMGVVPIAGELLDQGGGDLDVKATLLSTSDSDTDSQKKGVRLTLHGGYYPMTGNNRVEQRAIIDFVCDSRDGTEGEWDPEDKYDDDYGDSDKGDNKENLRKREDEGDGKKGKQEEVPRSKETQFTRDENPALVFESYGYEGNDEKIQILRMTWHTKAACTRDDTGGDQSKESRSWGFFSWVVILAFLAIASYLIFGSWLNYNRYGARGWDLVPHGDAIRDVPYLLKDWGRRVLNTVQGGGSRGGYSAV